MSLKKKINPKRQKRLKIQVTVVPAAGPVRKTDIPPQSERARIRFHSRIWVETSVNPRGTEPLGEENTVPDRLGRENMHRERRHCRVGRKIYAMNHRAQSCVVLRETKKSGRIKSEAV